MEKELILSDLFEMTSRQAEAWRAMQSHRYILYGGARGGGKSRFLRWSLLIYLLSLYKHEGIRDVRVMLACETYPDLRERQISKIELEFPREIGDLRETQEDGLCFFISQNLGGSKIALRNLDKPAKYQSAEFAIIAVDELTKNPIETFNILRGSLRWPNFEHTLFLGATNPGDIGHAWVKQLWIDRDFPPELEPRKHEFIFVQSLPKDNPHLPQSYWDELNSLPPDLRRAWVEGDWSVFAGQAFPGWRNYKHVIEPFELPENWVRWRAVDWGFSNPFCCLWMCKNPDNSRIYIYREAYERELTDRQQARLIQDLTPRGEHISITYADPSMWSRKNIDSFVTSTSDEYLAEGVPLTKADNDRLSGKRKIDRLLQDLPDGKPGLQVFSNCINFIRTVPMLARAKTNPEDVDTNQEDHAFDAGRYGLSNTQHNQQKRAVVRQPMEGIKIL